MKNILFILIILTGSVFGAIPDYGVIAAKHYTIRTKSLVCAIDVITLSSGKTVTEKICFKI